MTPTSLPKNRLIAASTNFTVSILVAAALLLTVVSIDDLGADEAAGESVAADTSANQASANDPSAESVFTADSLATVDFGPARIAGLSRSAMEFVTFDWHKLLPEWTVSFVPGDGDVAGYTWSKEERIEIFVREDSTPEFLYRVLAHELGHAVDVSLNSGDDRRAWLEARDIADAPWWPGSGKADFETGAGDFAESFAVWMTGQTTDFRSELGSAPDTKQLQVMSDLVGIDT